MRSKSEQRFKLPDEMIRRNFYFASDIENRKRVLRQLVEKITSLTKPTKDIVSQHHEASFGNVTLLCAN